MKKTIFIKNALILTVSSLILRFVGIIFKVWLAQRYGDRVRAVSTMECNLELTDREGSKGAALAALCQMLNIPTAQVMALGDADNDIGMLQTAGIGVAMSNAIPEVQAAADWITLSNEEDGVAHAIHSLLGI